MMLKISKLKIINYKLFQNVIIEMNDTMNIFVGENDSGKNYNFRSTINGVNW